VYSRGPKYLWKKNLDKLSKEEAVRALLELRCGNLEQINIGCMRAIGSVFFVVKEKIMWNIM